MERIDQDGKWTIDNGIEMLIEPSQEWINNNIPSSETLNEEKLNSIRQKRNSLLLECDWTQLLDCPLTLEKKEEWRVYRQQLRDFPTIADLDNPIFPEKPV